MNVTKPQLSEVELIGLLRVVEQAGGVDNVKSVTIGEHHFGEGELQPMMQRAQQTWDELAATIARGDHLVLDLPAAADRHSKTGIIHKGLEHIGHTIAHAKRQAEELAGEHLTHDVNVIKNKVQDWVEWGEGKAIDVLGKASHSGAGHVLHADDLHDELAGRIEFHPEIYRVASFQVETRAGSTYIEPVKVLDLRASMAVSQLEKMVTGAEEMATNVAEWLPIPGGNLVGAGLTISAGLAAAAYVAALEASARDVGDLELAGALHGSVKKARWEGLLGAVPIAGKAAEWGVHVGISAHQRAMKERAARLDSVVTLSARAPDPQATAPARHEEYVAAHKQAYSQAQALDRALANAQVS